MLCPCRGFRCRNRYVFTLFSIEHGIVAENRHGDDAIVGFRVFLAIQLPENDRSSLFTPPDVTTKAKSLIVCQPVWVIEAVAG